VEAHIIFSHGKTTFSSTKDARSRLKSSSSDFVNSSTPSSIASATLYKSADTYTQAQRSGFASFMKSKFQAYNPNSLNSITKTQPSSSDLLTRSNFRPVYPISISVTTEISTFAILLRPHHYPIPDTPHLGSAATGGIGATATTVGIALILTGI
jgi:hypothetical protein